MVWKYFFRAEHILLGTVVACQIWQRWRFVSDQVGIVFGDSYLCRLPLGLSEDRPWVVSSQLVVSWSRHLGVCWSIFHHLVWQFVELESSRESLSCVNHDLGFVFMLASCNASGILQLFFSREQIVYLISRSFYSFRRLWWTLSLWSHKTVWLVYLSGYLDHKGLFFELLNL